MAILSHPSLLLTLHWLVSLYMHPSEAFTIKKVNTKNKNSNLHCTTSSESTKPRKVSILLCPAQFCVPDDYSDLFQKLKTRFSTHPSASIGACRVAPLPRTEWIKVAKQLPTVNFIKGSLDVKETLHWYFDAIEKGLCEILEEEGGDTDICIIGHSIGGWVARAYLGGLSDSSTAIHSISKQCISSFITLGTPHLNPHTALVDQTRGLLNTVCNSESCTSLSLIQRGIKVTCVGSTSIPGNIFTTKIDQIVAATSYIPLTGTFHTLLGDGIVPASLSFMDSPATKILIQNKVVRHSHVLPTPWNLWDAYAKSIVLPEEYADWYGSDHVLNEWADSII